MKESISVDEVNASYVDLLGALPNMIEYRQRLAIATGRESAVQAIEQMRNELIHSNPLDRRTQQLVHFAMLIGLGAAGPARLHAAGAVKAGASLSDLQGVAETAAIVCGMPGYSLAVESIAALGLINSPNEADSNQNHR